MKKKIYAILLICFAACNMQAQQISYSYHLFSTDGCTVNFTAAYVNDSPKIVVTLTSENLIFTENPTMLLKFYDDTVLELVGQQENISTQNGAIMVGYVAVPYSEKKSIAIFNINTNDIYKLRNGVSKIRISTLPTTHERKFKNDRIGLPLYEQFQREKTKKENF